MERVEITTSRLGDRRKLPKYGNAQLPGQHTLEVCFLECDVSSKPSSGVKVNTTKVIKSDCIVMVSEEDIQFVPIDNADMVDIVRSFVKGIKYVIKLGKIADISILQGEDDEMAVGAKTVRNLKQPQPRRIIIHLHCGSDCKIATNGHGSTHLAKQIQSAWQSTIVLRSAQLPKLNSSADSATAEEYLCETVNSLKGTTDLLLKTDIFDEFANEVWVDLQLKHAACNSRELFVSTIALCKELLRTPAELSIEAKSILHRSNDQPNSVFDDKFTPASSTRSFGNSFRSFGNSSVIGSSVSHRSMTSISNERNRAGETTSETQLRLQATALQRLVLVRSALKVIPIS